MNAAEKRAAIVAEAMSWIGTPYVECGDIKGPQGAVDCGMLLVRVFVDLGFAPPFDPRPYKPDWHLHRTAALYVAWLEKYSHKTNIGRLGDIAMYKYGRHASHGGIIVSDDLIVHAHKTARQVELFERRTIVDKLDSYWSIF